MCTVIFPLSVSITTSWSADDLVLAGEHEYVDFYAVLMRVGVDALTVKWLVPFRVLAQLRSSLAQHARIEPRMWALSSAYSDDVPMEWAVGTVALCSPPSVYIPFGRHPCCLSVCSAVCCALSGKSTRCVEVSAQLCSAYYIDGQLVPLLSKQLRVFPTTHSFTVAAKEALLKVCRRLSRHVC